MRLILRWIRVGLNDAGEEGGAWGEGAEKDSCVEACSCFGDAGKSLMHSL